MLPLVFGLETEPLAAPTLFSIGPLKHYKRNVVYGDYRCGYYRFPL
jgi:hypothetical protein